MSSLLKLEIFVLFTIIFSFVASNNGNIPSFDVTCDVSGVHVLLKFEKPFDGIVYSANHNFDAQCRKSADSNNNVILFLPIHACGNEVQGNRTRSISNSIVVQQHRLLQTVHDLTQDIMCEVFSSSKRFFLHKFPRSNADDIEFQELEIWADLKLGSDLDGISTKKVNLGTKLLLIIHVKDGGMHNDMNIQNCMAHTEEPIKNTSNVAKLSDEYGCPYSLEMIGEFNSTKGTKNVSDMMAYTELRAFKFPSQENMFITCGVQLCKHVCMDTCSNFHAINPVKLLVRKERVKRSYEDSSSIPIKGVENRNRFLKATLNAFISTLGKSKKQRALANTNSLEKRLFQSIDIDDSLEVQTSTEGEATMIHDSNIYSTKEFEKHQTTTVANSNKEKADSQYKFIYSDIQTKNSSTTEILNASRGLPIMNSIHSFDLTTNPSNIEANFYENIYVNVTKAFFVMNSDKNFKDFTDDHRDESKTTDLESVPKIRFSLVTGMLSAIVFCLVLTCAALVLHMRREKKKHLIDNFLLYNFD